MKDLNEFSIQYVKGVGPAKKKLFQHLGIETIEDLLYFFPRRYEDRTQMTPLNRLQAGQWHTVSGKVMSQGGRQSWFTRKHVTEVAITDQKNRLWCVWFNQPFVSQYLREGQQVVLYGKVDTYKNRLQMVSPEYEIISDKDDEQLSVGRIVPIYSLTRGISQRYLRKIINTCLNTHAGHLREVLPYNLRNQYRLLNIVKSIRNIHFPENLDVQRDAHRRVSFEEFFLFQIAVLQRRLSIVQNPGHAHTIDDELLDTFIHSFPFPLTKAQIKVIREIRNDMQSPAPMLRLLQGDVGCGKTVAAFLGCVAAYKNRRQAAVMAPTEILARQHYETLSQMIKDGPFKKMRVALLVSGIKPKEKKTIYDQLKKGTIDLLIGTHALIQERVDFKDLSYVVIDEQHKFGVRQRALLTAKGTNPDVLIMTATPIPRTLCLTLFADLNTSVIDEMPPGRGKVATQLFDEEKIQEVYSLVKEKVQQGRQAYIIYPLVEDSEKLDLKAATKMFKHFKAHEFKGLRVGLVHGQMDRAETEDMMKQFKEHKIDILVATTVLEVGIDVPNAGVMVIEHAERFGLAQIHQLRGRIGRGKEDALCLLVADTRSPQGTDRLRAVLTSNDGFKIAQADLMIRGPGQFFGRHQHGLNELKFANPVDQLDILEAARKEAVAISKEDPRLQKAPNILLKSVIRTRYPSYLAMVSAG